MHSGVQFGQSQAYVAQPAAAAGAPGAYYTSDFTSIPSVSSDYSYPSSGSFPPPQVPSSLPSPASAPAVPAMNYGPVPSYSGAVPPAPYSSFGAPNYSDFTPGQTQFHNNQVAPSHPYAPAAPSLPAADPGYDLGFNYGTSPVAPPAHPSFGSYASYETPAPPSGRSASPLVSSGHVMPPQMQIPPPPSAPQPQPAGYGSPMPPVPSGGYPEGNYQGDFMRGAPQTYRSYDQDYGHNDGGYYQPKNYDRAGGDQLLGAYGQGYGGSSESEGVYRYDGGQSEPYGSRGTGSNSWGLGSSTGEKITRATPKVDTTVSGNGVQKYRVKLLSESSYSDPPTDVICQIGLDGVRLLSPNTNKTIRIYPLDTITKWEVSDTSIFTFWAKSSVDVEQRRIRLQASSYTSTAILDTLTAACVQVCEMVGKDFMGESSKQSSSTVETSESAQKKSSFAEWMALKTKPLTVEEKQHWVPDEAVTKCTACDSDFGAFLRRHHCRNCGDIFCDKCTRGRTALNNEPDSQPVRVCDRCLAEVTQRLANMETSSKSSSILRSHEDLAKKLQEEMERNASKKGNSGSSVGADSGKSGQMSVLNCNKCGNISLVTGNKNRCPNCGSSGQNSEARNSSGRSGQQIPESGPNMREVACPTCTVHLQVQVPKSGTQTVECGVCQHPFLVSAH